MDLESFKSGKLRTIKQCKDFAELYEFGKVVMPSCHRAMEIRFATRVASAKGATGRRQDVVVKVRRKPGSFSTPEDEKAWRQNTELVLNLPDCPSIARIDEVLEDACGYYVVMEKVDGLDLHETLHAWGPMSLDDVKAVLRQLLQAIGQLHTAGCIHKDLKLENVMLDKSPTGRSDRTTSTSASLPTNSKEGAHPGLIKLIDFDTVEDWSPKSPKATRVLGTDQYIAPEAYEGRYSPASDIFAIGVIAYRLLANSFPFRESMFDDKPGENWVGSPKMREIRDRLQGVRLDWQKPDLLALAPQERGSAQRLLSRMLAVNELHRPTAKEALLDPWLAGSASSGEGSKPRRNSLPASSSTGNLAEIPGGGGHFAWSQRAFRRLAASPGGGASAMASAAC